MAGSTSGFSNSEGMGGLSQENLEITELFASGMTSRRIGNVLPALRPLILRLQPVPEPVIIAHHGGGSSHEGWPAEQMLSRKAVRRRGAIAMEEIRGHTLFVPFEEGGLRACITSRSGSRDIDITSHLLEQHDHLLEGRHPSSSAVPEDARWFNTVSIGIAITQLAIGYGILDKARDFAVGDAPKPGR